MENLANAMSTVPINLATGTSYSQKRAKPKWDASVAKNAEKSSKHFSNVKQIKAKLYLLGTAFILSSCVSDYAPLPSHDPSYLTEESYIAIATKNIKKEHPEVPVISHAIFHNARNFMSPHWVAIKRNALGKITSNKVYYGFSYIDASSITGTHYIHDRGSISITMAVDHEVY